MKQLTINAVRKYYELPDGISDEQIRNELKGSMGESLVELGLAIKRLKRSMYESLPATLKKFF